MAQQITTTTTARPSLANGAPNPAYWTAQAVAFMQEQAPAGSTVQATTHHVSRSGLTRWIRLFVTTGDRVTDLTSNAAAALGEPVAWKNGEATIKVGGVGMDMQFHLVYRLALVLHGDGYALRKETI